VSVTAVASLVPRRRATVAGEIRSVRSFQRPYPRTDVRLDDGTGAITARFMGRISVRGLLPGLRMIATGTPGPEHGALAMLNPLYCLGRAE
jgi:hypothetical protein